MRHLDLDRLKSAEVVPYPFEFAIIPRFLGAETIEGVNATFPDIKVGGSCPAESLAAGMVIKEVIEHDSREFEEIIENKSGLSLRGRPKMYSLRAHTRAKDGKISPIPQTRSSSYCCTSTASGRTRWEDCAC